jgi:hypothetical protein
MPTSHPAATEKNQKNRIMYKRSPKQLAENPQTAGLVQLQGTYEREFFSIRAASVFKNPMMSLLPYSQDKDERHYVTKYGSSIKLGGSSEPLLK